MSPKGDCGGSYLTALDDTAWADRNEFWAAQRSPRQYRARRQRCTQPLVLCGHGVRLSVDRGTLAIDDGFTHYPQERQTYRFFKGDLNLPPRIIMLDGSGSLSFDVISWLSEQNVPLIRADYQGDVASVIGGSGFAADPERLRWQLDTRNDPNRRLDFCCDLIVQKLRNSLRTMAEVLPDASRRQVAVARAESGISMLERRAVQSVDEVREIEMRAAAAYFMAWRGLELKWRSRWKHPVPEDWLAIGSRRSMRRPMANNRNATHPVNAVLNYAYAMLCSQVHIASLANGYDPRRGIMHHDREDDAHAFAFVFDMMEPGRPIVDGAMLKFLSATELTGADFVIRSDGVCRLAPQLARRVCEAAAGAVEAMVKRNRWSRRATYR
jgi:CRISPR-associated protein Cas1